MPSSKFISNVAFLTAIGAALLTTSSVSRAAPFSDGGFEGTPVTSFSNASPFWVPPYYVYVPGTSNATASAGPWTYTDPAVLAGSGGAGLINVTLDPNAFYGATPPAGYGGNQFAFLQNGGSFQQTFSATPGAGTISWLEANRPSFGGIESYEVYLNNAPVGSYSGTLGAFSMVSASVVLAAINTLEFRGLFTNPDSTVFIDDVTVTIADVTPTATTPLPAALPLFVGGAGLLGLLARRRKKSAAIAA